MERGLTYLSSVEMLAGGEVTSRGKGGYAGCQILPCHLGIRNSQHLVSGALEDLVPLGIALYLIGIRMHSPVDLEDQFEVVAIEIHHESSHGMLAPKLESE